MPIRPENRARYPADWPAISLGVRSRAGWRCEACGVRNRAWGWRDAVGSFHELHGSIVHEYRRDGERPPFWMGACRIIEIVLTVAHLNHTPEDCRPENLKALCQRCHLRYDAAEKRARRARREAEGSGELFP